MTSIWYNCALPFLDKDVAEMAGKIQYKVRNWSQYNRALVNRGNITIWLDEDVTEHWYSAARTGRKGRPMKYADQSIQLCLTLRFIYHLPLRATEGFVT